MSISLVDCWHAMWNAIFDGFKHQIRKEQRTSIPAHLNKNGIARPIFPWKMWSGNKTTSKPARPPTNIFTSSAALLKNILHPCKYIHCQHCWMHWYCHLETMLGKFQLKDVEDAAKYIHGAVRKTPLEVCTIPTNFLPHVSVCWKYLPPLTQKSKSLSEMLKMNIYLKKDCVMKGTGR